jgi:O-antigen/teichoic acid export membrane protein
MSELRKRTAVNIGFNGMAVLSVSVIQFVSSIILARLLLPTDYGIAGFALIFINFMTQFSDFGIGSALIQKADADNDLLYTGFTLKALFSVFAFVFLFALAPASRFFSDNTAIIPAVRMLSLGFLISVLAFLPQVTLTRELRYKELSYPQVIGAAGGAVCAVAMAHAGFGFWSIIAGSLINSLAVAVMLNLIRPTKFHFRLEKNRARHILSFGSHLFLPGVIVFLIFNTDNFAIGALKGAEQLGYYAIAFNWGSLICVLLAGIVHQVLFPTFSKFQHDLAAIKGAYLESVRYVAFVALPFNLFLAVLGRQFLLHVLGGNTERWLPALAALQILCVYGVLRALLEPLANVVNGLGKPRLYAGSTLLVAVIQLTLLYPALRLGGIEGVAVIVTISYLSQYLIWMRILKREIDVSASEVWATARPAFIASGFSLLSVLLLRRTFESSIPLMLLEILIGGAAYFLIYGILTKWQLVKEMKALTR